jgi:hypothetical protein
MLHGWGAWDTGSAHFGHVERRVVASENVTNVRNEKTSFLYEIKVIYGVKSAMSGCKTLIEGNAARPYHCAPKELASLRLCNPCQLKSA